MFGCEGGGGGGWGKEERLLYWFDVGGFCVFVLVGWWNYVLYWCWMGVGGGCLGGDMEGCLLWFLGWGVIGGWFGYLGWLV